MVSAIDSPREKVRRFSAMFMISVEWLDEAKTRARFGLPGREEWRAEHIDALMQILAQVREEMSPPLSAEPPPLQEAQASHNPCFRTHVPLVSACSRRFFQLP